MANRGGESGERFFDGLRGQVAEDEGFGVASCLFEGGRSVVFAVGAGENGDDGFGLTVDEGWGLLGCFFFDCLDSGDVGGRGVFGGGVVDGFEGGGVGFLEVGERDDFFAEAEGFFGGGGSDFLEVIGESGVGGCFEEEGVGGGF